MQYYCSFDEAVMPTFLTSRQKHSNNLHNTGEHFSFFTECNSFNKKKREVTLVKTYLSLYNNRKDNSKCPINA